jgi:hypothetical protein
MADAPPTTAPTSPSTPPLPPGEGAGNGAAPSAATAPPGVPLSSVLMDEGLRKHPSLARYQYVDALGKGYVDLEKKLGERPGLTPLGENPSAEEVAAYRKGLGIPESPAGYELPELAFPELATPKPEQLEAFKSLAHELHLTPAQFSGLLDWYQQDVSAQWATLQQAREQENQGGYEVLERKYGAQAMPMLQTAREYIRRRFGPEAFTDLDSFKVKDPETGQMMMLGASPTFIEIVAENARLTGHDKFVIGDSRGNIMNKEAARAKLAELRALYRDGKLGREDYTEQYNRYAPTAYSD